MIDSGWIKIDRRIVNHWLWQDAERLKWWLDLLFMASWEDKQALHDTHVFTLRRGQIIASAAYLSDRWKRHRLTVSKYLKLLEEEGMIKRSTIYRQTAIITICNYDKCQCGKEQGIDTIVDTIVDTINRENPRCIADRQKKDLKSCDTESLRCLSETKIDTMVDTIIDTIVDTNKEYKEYISTTSTAPARPREEKFFIEEMKNDTYWCQVMAMRFCFQTVDVFGWLDKFLLDLQCRGVTHQNLGDAKRHFNDWLRIQLQNEKKNGNGKSESEDKKNKRRSFEVSATSEEDYSTSF